MLVMKTSREGAARYRMCGCPGTITAEVRPGLALIFPMHQQSE
jgi:hypothetical protein